MFLEGAGASGSESSSVPPAPPRRRRLPEDGTMWRPTPDEDEFHSSSTWVTMADLSALASTPSTRLSCRYLKEIYSRMNQHLYPCKIFIHE